MKISLWVLVMNHYAARIARARRDRRIRHLQVRGPQQVPASLLAILGADGEWRVADAGAPVAPGERCWPVEIGPNTRGHEIESRCREILAEAGS